MGARCECGSRWIFGYWTSFPVAFVCQRLAKVKLTCVYLTLVATERRVEQGTVPGESCHRNVTAPASYGAQMLREG